MPDKPAVFVPPSARTAAQRDVARAAAQPWRAWYKRAIWNHPVHGLRAMQLRAQPLCECCLAKSPPVVTAATVVHHRVPHRGDWARFVDRANHVSVCKACHDGELQAAERAAVSPVPAPGVGGCKSLPPAPPRTGD